MSILVIGSSNFDLTVYCDRLPGPGETVLGGRFASGIGGKGANQATAARRMGGDVTFFSAVGDDGHGRAIRDHFAAEGVTCLWADVPPGVATGAALILVDGRGQNSIAVAPGANASIGADAMGSIPFHDFSHVLISLEIPLEAATRAATLARTAGCCVLVNPAPACLLPEALLQQTDILLPNEQEVFLLMAQRSSSHEECAARLFAHGVGCLIVTLGEQGAKVLRQTGAHSVRGFPAQAVDTVGAGDCFCGVFTASLAATADLANSTRTANAAASLSVQRPGAIASYPDREEILNRVSSER
jgi:ribokinase